MKRILFTLFLVSICATALLAQGVHFVPDYYQQSDFLLTSPGVSGDAAGAFFNPAVWGMVKGPELQVYWSDMEREPGGKENWAGIFGSKRFGFGLQQWTYGEQQIESQYKERRLYDYNIAFADGNDEMSFGLGYSWSKGHISKEMPRDNILSFGTLSRPCRHLSIGAAGHYGLDNRDLRGVFDIGVRPFGTPLLILFADASLFNYQRLGDAPWAIGAAMEPLPGIAVYAKYYDKTEAYNLGFSVSLGTIRLSSSSHYNKDNENVYNTHGVRAGFHQKNIFTPAIMKNKCYVKMNFDKQLKYQRYRFFDWDDRTLMETLELLEEVKNDERVAGIAVRITEEMYGSWALLWEVREKIKEVRSAGKKVYVFLERGGMRHYYLASAADKIVVDPECMVVMPGFLLGRTYYRNLADKLGIGVDEWRFFTYKSAFESYSRTSMSDPDREQRQALCDGWYEVFRNDICESRNIPPEKLDHIVNEAPILTADSLLYYSLADTLGRWEDMSDYIKSVEGKGKCMMSEKAFMAVIPKDDEWGVPPQIAVIYALGSCSMNTGINANRLKGVIKAAREDGKVKAVVFRADSPGGDPLPSDIVAAELKKTAEKKPVIVSQGFVAASGGYWISMYGDKIIATPMTVTGSIGVISGWIYNDGFGDKIGLTYDHTRTGAHADILGGLTLPLIGVQIPDRKLTPEERKYVEKLIKGLYSSFLQKVAEHRNMTVEAVDEVGQGRVWIGAKGKEIGLVDEIGGMEKAIQMAREAAGIKPERKVELKEMPEKGVFNPAIFQPKLFGYDVALFEQGTERAEMEYYQMLLKSGGKPLLLTPPEFYMVD